MLMGRYVTLLRLLAGLLSCGSEPTPRPFSTLAPEPPVRVKDPAWSSVSLETVCAEIGQSFTTPDGMPINTSLPVQEVVEPLLADLGLDAVNPSSEPGQAAADRGAALSAAVTGQSIVEQYEIIGPCHEGDALQVDLALGATRRETRSLPLSHTKTSLGRSASAAKLQRLPSTSGPARKRLLHHDRLVGSNGLRSCPVAPGPGAGA